MPTLMDFYNTGLEAAKNEALSPYIAPTAQAELQGKLLANKYYPQLTEADIASKQAYANFLPAQIAAQVYSNPMMAYLITKGRIPNPLRQWGINLPGQGSVLSNPQNNRSGLGEPLSNKNDEVLNTLPTSSVSPNNGMSTTLANSAPAQNEGLAQVDLSGGAPMVSGANPVPQGIGAPIQMPASSAPSGLNSFSPIKTGDPVLDTMYANMFSGLGRDPRFDTGKGGPGATYVNPQTGTGASIPTTQTASLNQQTIDAVDRVSPLIQDIAKNIPQFQSFWTRREEQLGGLGNEFFGGNYKLPSQLAQGQADIKNSAEGLIRAWGLRPTNYQTKVMMEAIQPHHGESPDGYAQRLVNTLQTLQANQNLAKQNQSQGISLEQKNKVYTWNPKTGSIE